MYVMISVRFMLGFSLVGLYFTVLVALNVEVAITAFYLLDDDEKSNL